MTHRKRKRAERFARKRERRRLEVLASSYGLPRLHRQSIRVFIDGVEYKGVTSVSYGHARPEFTGSIPVKIRFVPEPQLN